MPDSTPPVEVVAETIDADPGVVAPGLARRKWEHAQLRALEDELFLESMTMLRDALRFPEVLPGTLEQWTEELGSEGLALRRMAIAEAGRMAAKDAPIALQLAKSVVTAVSKSRRDSGQDAPPLGIQVQIVLTPPTYPKQRLSE